MDTEWIYWPSEFRAAHNNFVRQLCCIKFIFANLPDPVEPGACASLQSSFHKIAQRLAPHFKARLNMKKINKSILPLGMAFSIFLLGGCAQMQMGDDAAKTTATGSAGGAQANNANSKLEKCDAPLGTVGIIEDTQAPWYGILTGQMHLGSTAPVIKLIAQQSNCFIVVDRGRGLDAAMRERSLRDAGEMRKGSNMQQGQMVAADFTISPSVTFSNNNAGGGGAALGALLPGMLGAVAGSIHAKEASTLLTLVDNRSGVQLAASEGSARNFDFGAGGALFGGVLGAAGGGYSNTAEGKVIVAAFTDSFNGLVRAVRNYKAQTVAGGLGTGGRLAVQGANSPALRDTPAPSGNGRGKAPLADFLTTECSKEELGRVTSAKLLDYRQANTIFKAGRAAASAKPGDIYLQVVASSKATRKSTTIQQLTSTPTQAEVAALIGKPQCAFEAED